MLKEWLVRVKNLLAILCKEPYVLSDLSDCLLLLEDCMKPVI